MGKKLTIFVAEHCPPCQILKEIAASGGFGEEVEVVDVESEEGFPQIAEKDLTEIPSAFQGEMKCEIRWSDTNVEIVCPAKEEADVDSS